MSLTQTQELELIRIAQHGSSKASKDAINQLLVEHQPALYQYAMTAVGDHSKAEQAVQNTLIHVWQALKDGSYVHNPDIPNQFRHWICSVCKNRNYQVQHGRVPTDSLRMRERARVRGYEKYTWTSTSSTPTIEQAETRIAIEQSNILHDLSKQISCLPRRNKRVFSLYTNGYSCKEISRMLNLTEKSVRNRISEARTIIKKTVTTEVPNE